MDRSCNASIRAQRQSCLAKQQNNERTMGRRSVDQILTGKHPIVSSALRAVLYISITAGVFQSIFYATQHIDANILFAENMIMEWLQLGMLISCALLLKISSHQMRELHQGFHLLCLLPLIAAVRELDNVLDVYMFDGAWQMLASILIIYVSTYAWKHYQTLKQQLLHILSFSPTGLLISGFITVIVFSRLFGQQIFWQAVLQENYLRLVARAVEEGCEFFGYLLLLFGCIEFFVIAISSRSKKYSKMQRMDV